jgi:F-type H+-transporting ATPase subunit delta
MAEVSTIARPYAEAVFRLADASGTLGDWSDMLGNLAQVAADPGIAAAIADPNLTSPKVAGMFIGILGGRLTGEAENLVRVLAENKRLEVLAEIANQFEVLKNEREGMVEAEIVSAFPLDDAQLRALLSQIETKAGKRVKAQVSVDSELIAGVRVVIGDKVIDGSVRAQLAALEATLKR